MSHIRSLLHSIYDKRHYFSVDCYRPMLVVSICTISTVSLLFAGEEPYITGTSLHVQAKENYSYTVELSENQTSESTIEDQENYAIKTSTADGLTEYASIQLVLAKEQEEAIETSLATQQQTKCSQAREAAETQRQIAIQKEIEAKEKAAKEKAAKEKAAKEKAAKEKAAKEKAAKEKAAKEKAAKEKAAKEKAEKEKNKITLSSSERSVLEHIVQAEAGNQDIKGRMLVANVVINRMKSSKFPNTVKGVVFQHSGSSYQFSPAKSGSVNTVTVTSKTKQAVQRVLNGEDYSEGALFFVARSSANKKSLSWFDRSLTRLFTHGGHTFYK